ncbi:MAG: ribosome small subunit-dependent GTPase A [Gammaproteobacteria bacterium]|nr:ribosome small subunit-dependent GTPase A [Gammaproteobacteria bacterium]
MDKKEKDGIVMYSVGSSYLVLTEDGHQRKCRIKGKLRTTGVRTTNPVAVGDHVVFEDASDDTATIKSIKPRRNSIIRKSVKLSRRAHIIAANIDQAYLVVTLVNPPTSTGFIDRFLVTAELHDIPVCLVFNKIDLHGKAENQLLKTYRSIYTGIGYECLELSALDTNDINRLRNRLDNQVNLFSGHSGVGKSTLINAISPGLNLKTAGTSDHYHLGRHTTTFAEMFPLPTGGYIIDTPGIKGFGIVYLEKEEIMNQFREIREIREHCKFANCIHDNEPECAVKHAVESGNIASSRYQNYLSIYHTDEDETYR